MSEYLNKNNVGWIYCMINPCMPGLVKVGMTKSPKRLPSIRANELFTTGVPLPFEVVLKKLVINPVAKETSLHNLLSKYSERINSGREFFKVSIDVVKDFFDLIDGLEHPNNLGEEIPHAHLEKKIDSCVQLSEVDKYWNEYPKQKQQLLDWKIEYNKKSTLPSISADSGTSEKIAANLRQRIRARQATPHCWPQNEDNPETVKLKENMIAAVVGGRWFDRN